MTIAAKGEETDTAIFEAVGRATSDWEYFEAYFGLLFGALVEAPDHTGAAMRAYGTVQSFKARSAMVVAAAKAYFLRHPRSEFETQFNDLIGWAGALSGRRNEIAHGIVQPYFPDGQERSGWALVPSFNATNKRVIEAANKGIAPYKSTGKYAYVATEVKDFSSEVQELTKQTMALYRKLF
jgi:hypothetical protein